MTCLFTTCHRPSATHSRAGACAMHEAELQTEWQRLMRRTQHECPEHPRVERELWDAETPERVLIYGSRDWSDPEPIRAFVDSLAADTVVIHGAAPGADTIAGKLAKARGLKVDPYPADWKTHGRAAGPIRNQQMVDEGKPTRGRGFRLPGKSDGTDDMTKKLARAGIPHEVTVTA